MRRILSIFCALLLLFGCLAACASADRLQLDMYSGSGRYVKLLHLDGARAEGLEHIRALGGAFEGAEELPEGLSALPPAPDYELTLHGASLSPETGFALTEDGGTAKVMVYLNGPHLDLVISDGAGGGTVYRAKLSAEEFQQRVDLARQD